jgi:hypothetical protein
MKNVTASVHAECCYISSAELYRCQLPEDGQIIAPKHVTAMQKTVRIVPYRYNSTCALTVTYYVAVGLKKFQLCEDGQIIAPKHVVAIYKTVRGLI